MSKTSATDTLGRLSTVVIVLGVVLIAVLVTTGTVLADEDPRSELDGNGTEADPFVATTAEELQQIDDIEIYRDEELDVEQFHYVLENDIDATETDEWEGGAGFDPIGDGRSIGLTGTFDGQGYTISGLHIARPADDYVGLFGYSEGTVENVRLESVTVIGDGEVGAVVGRNDHSGVIDQVWVSGEIKGTDRRVGGVVGRNYGEVSGSSMVGDIDSTDRQVGGVVGGSYGAVDKSFFVGTIAGDRDVGGVIGNNQGSLRAAFASGEVEGERRVGGVVGTNVGAVSEVYSLMDIDGNRDVAGLIGTNSGTVSSAYAAGSIDGDRRVAGTIASNDGIAEVLYWDLEATGTDQAFADQDGNQADIAGLEPWELTGENATEHTELDFDSPWTTSDEYPRLEWEADRDIPDEAYDVDFEIQTEPPEPEPETETTTEEADDGFLPVSRLWLVAGIVLLGLAGGGGFYGYRQLQEEDEEQRPRRQSRRRR